jgi:hypothetical protein
VYQLVKVVVVMVVVDVVGILVMMMTCSSSKVRFYSGILLVSKVWLVKQI